MVKDLNLRLLVFSKLRLTSVPVISNSKLGVEKHHEKVSLKCNWITEVQSCGLTMFNCVTDKQTLKIRIGSFLPTYGVLIKRLYGVVMITNI